MTKVDHEATNSRALPTLSNLGRLPPARMDLIALWLACALYSIYVLWGRNGLANQWRQAIPIALWLVVPTRTVSRRSNRRVWGLLVGWLLASLTGSSPATGQSLRVLGIPLDSLLNVKNPLVDTAYIATYYSRFHLYIVSDRQTYGLQVGNPAQELHYKPHLFWALGIGFDYKWANSQLTLKIPLLSQQPTQKGRTTPFSISLQANTNNRRFWLAGQYQSYRGFYLANPDVLAPDERLTLGSYPSRRDIRIQTMTTHVEYVVNALRLSTPASLLQREGQRKAAGSWLLGGFLTYFQLEADSALVPPAWQAGVNAELSATRFSSFALGVDGGYRQTIIVGRGYFLTVSLQPGVSILLEHDNARTGTAGSVFRVGWQGLGAVSMGYSSARYYGGLYGSINLTNRGVGASLIRTEGAYIRAVVGKRIRYSPKGLLKKVPGL